MSPHYKRVYLFFLGHCKLRQDFFYNLCVRNGAQSSTKDWYNFKTKKQNKLNGDSLRWTRYVTVTLIITNSFSI